MNYCIYCMNSLPEGSSVCPHCLKSQDYNCPPHHLLPGTRLSTNGRYVVGASIGNGGFAITYIAKDTILGTKVAIKEFFPSGFVTRSHVSGEKTVTAITNRSNFFEHGKRRMLDEARTLARFADEPCIVGVRDCFEENNTAYIVMEFIDGQTLESRLKQTGRMSVNDTIKLLLPVMGALQKVHGTGIIHRDISPSNIMVSGNRTVLIDFGAARQFSGEDVNTMTVFLKHGYAPEEQYRSKGKQGPWTDIYALSATIYRCITGQKPEEATERVYADNTKRPGELGVAISTEQENAIMKGLAVKATDRYHDLSDFIQALTEQEKENKNFIPDSEKETVAPIENKHPAVDLGKKGEHLLTYQEYKERFSAYRTFAQLLLLVYEKKCASKSIIPDSEKETVAPEESECFFDHDNESVAHEFRADGHNSPIVNGSYHFAYNKKDEKPEQNSSTPVDGYYHFSNNKKSESPERNSPKKTNTNGGSNGTINNEQNRSTYEKPENTGSNQSKNSHYTFYNSPSTGQNKSGKRKNSAYLKAVIWIAVIVVILAVGSSLWQSYSDKEETTTDITVNLSVPSIVTKYDFLSQKSCVDSEKLIQESEFMSVEESTTNKSFEITVVPAYIICSSNANDIIELGFLDRSGNIIWAYGKCSFYEQQLTFSKSEREYENTYSSQWGGEDLVYNLTKQDGKIILTSVDGKSSVTLE